MTLTTTIQTTVPPAIANPPATMGYKFLEFLARYTLRDIIQLETIGRSEEVEDQSRDSTDINFGTGRCTTALASLCFATIEQLGLILRTDLNPTNVSDEIKRGGVKNAISFFSFFGNHQMLLVHPPEIEAIYFLFRNKLTHNLFPKHELGICQNISNPLDRLVIEINGRFSLNVNFLSTYIKSAISLLKNLLADSSNTALIMSVDNNIQIIDAAEVNSLHQKFNHSSQIQQPFQQWLPHITF